VRLIEKHNSEAYPSKHMSIASDLRHFLVNGIAFMQKRSAHHSVIGKISFLCKSIFFCVMKSDV